MGEKIDETFILMRPVQRRVQDVFSPAINYKENRTLFLSQPKQEILQNLPSCLFLTSNIRIEMHFRRHLHLKSCVFIVNLPAMQMSTVDQTQGHSQAPWQQDTTCTVNEIILDLLDSSFDGGKPLAFTCSLWANLEARSRPADQNWRSCPTANFSSFQMELSALRPGCIYFL